MIAFFTKILGRSWLGRVYKVDKPLFLVLALFFAATIGFNVLKLQTTPFFVWHMYSAKMPETATYPYFQITYNHGRVVNLQHTWNEPQKSYLYMPLSRYVYDKAGADTDPFRLYLETWLKKHPRFAGLTRDLTITQHELDSYPAWLRSYLSTVTGGPIDEVTVLQKKVSFDASGAPVEVSSDTVLHLPPYE
jgi:hypothetical protein